MLGGVLSFRFNDWLESAMGSLRREPASTLPKIERATANLSQIDKPSS
jgi:hypothetical protein